MTCHTVQCAPQGVFHPQKFSIENVEIFVENSQRLVAIAHLSSAHSGLANTDTQ